MSDSRPVVTLGETMMVFNGPAHQAVGLHQPFTATFAGAESNLAVGLARLGHPVRFLSVLGDDPFGHLIARTLRGEGVDTAGVRFSPGHPTGVMFKVRHDPRAPAVLYNRRGSAFSQATGQTLSPDCYADARLIFLTGITPALSPGCLELIRGVMREARERGIPVWFDPNFRAKLWDAATFAQTISELLPLVDTLLPSLAEGRMLSARVEPAEVGATLIERGIRTVVLKAAEQGAFAFSVDGSAAHCERCAIDEVVDPVGAGDAFDAGYLSAHLEGLAAVDCLRRAHAAAAIVCRTQGDWEGLPTRGQVERFVGSADREEVDR
jgi:2-dehydro-3-deoxygluconokinase